MQQENFCVCAQKGRSEKKKNQGRRVQKRGKVVKSERVRTELCEEKSSPSIVTSALSLCEGEER